MAAEMEAAGVSPEDIAAFRAASDDDAEDEVVHVWPVNQRSFRVFTACRWRRVPVQGTDGLRLIYEGIDASEIASVCDLLSVPPAERATVLQGVRFAETVALPLLNRE